jgi:hypothetical protein
MKIGDLVRIKFSTNASMRRAKHYGISDSGFITEVVGCTCKVMFPDTNGKIRSFQKDCLEMINES